MTTEGQGPAREAWCSFILRGPAGRTIGDGSVEAADRIKGFSLTRRVHLSDVLPAKRYGRLSRRPSAAQWLAGLSTCDVCHEHYPAAASAVQHPPVGVPVRETVAGHLEKGI